jgi:hypothetical protein
VLGLTFCITDLLLFQSSDEQTSSIDGENMEYKTLAGKPQGKTRLGKPRQCVAMNWAEMVLNWDQWWTTVVSDLQSL